MAVLLHSKISKFVPRKDASSLSVSQYYILDMTICRCDQFLILYHEDGSFAAARDKSFLIKASLTDAHHKSTGKFPEETTKAEFCAGHEPKSVTTSDKSQSRWPSERVLKDEILPGIASTFGATLLTMTVVIIIALLVGYLVIAFPSFH
jgi:hypothetical protein